MEDDKDDKKDDKVVIILSSILLIIPNPPTARYDSPPLAQLPLHRRGTPSNYLRASGSGRRLPGGCRGVWGGAGGCRGGWGGLQKFWRENS